MAVDASTHRGARYSDASMLRYGDPVRPLRVALRLSLRLGIAAKIDIGNGTRENDLRLTIELTIHSIMVSGKERLRD
jgi:hypothetical protein